MTTKATGTASSTPSFDRLTAALELAVGPGRGSGEWVKYCCPVHEADGRRHNPSLIVKHLSDAGRTKVSCRAGCADEAVLAALGLQVRDLFDTPITRATGKTARPARPARRPVTAADRAIAAAGLPLVKTKTDRGQRVSRWQQTATYDYTHADGVVAGQIVRSEARFERGRDKKFHQLHWNPARGDFEPGGFDPIPFRLPQVLDAVAAGRWIYVCEGEKDVLTAENAGLVATTNAGGAMSWTTEHARWLDGAVGVVIVADRDAPGFRRAEKVAASLAGLVAQVRVVTARDGKDLTDHFNAGHGLDELDPVPYLDPLLSSTPAAGAESVSASPGGTPMSSLAYGSSEHAPADHAPDIDTAHSQLAVLVRLLLQQMLEFARRRAEVRRREEEEARRRSEEEQREVAERHKLERNAAEARLNRLRERGFDHADRHELARAVADAAEWSQDSEVANKTLSELRAHIHDRYGVVIDPDTLAADEDTTRTQSPAFLATMAKAELDQADDLRLRRAHERMVEIVAADTGLDESAKQALYAEISKWRTNPTPHTLDTLNKAMTAKGLGEATRAKVRFVADYIGVPREAGAPGEPGAPRPGSPTVDMRRMRVPLVDPGEEVKARLDRLIDSYRVKLMHGRDVAELRTQLADAAALLTAEDREQARALLRKVAANPAQVHKPLWPDHVDRTAVTDSVRMYAAMKPIIDAQAAEAKTPDSVGDQKMRERAQAHREVIERAIRAGKGLHPLERDQLELTLRDIDAGHVKLPEMVFADERTAAAIDRDRCSEIAHQTAQYHRHQLGQILTTASVPKDAATRAHNEIAALFEGQAQLAAGQGNLPDYEHHGHESRALAALASAGVPEPVRNQVRHHLDEAAGQSATAGKQANRIAETWRQRTAAVAAARAEATPDWDNPARRRALAADLQKADLTPDEVRQRMAADAGRGTPPSAAVNGTPGRAARQTNPGAGVQHTHHRGQQRGYGK
ncbi:toprim domain-containing protein [Nocardia niigatensis]|uniref:toprim domain-containing protein n=1 Tax=Nocardia niigatensis TaxID=209249 RepID=UPI0002F590A2|nr:toprim domain-containing protein [Nocardia niigatensis]